MKKNVLVGFLCLVIELVNVLHAQKQGNIWYFGDQVGLDFSSGSPTVLTNGQTYLIGNPQHSEGTSVICDSSGSLLFYTNGVKVWNRNHVIMANGDSLKGDPSSTQAALIIPRPGSSRYYYIFTTASSSGLRYSEVDMCLDSGKGDVLIAHKNILLLDTVTEKLTGVLHANQNDYWIVAHKFYSDAFYAFRLSSGGIISTVVSHIGSTHPASTVQIGAVIGQMKASPNGKKIALVNINCNPCVAEYFDFNDVNGALSNSVNIQTSPSWSYYGVSFSPDNSKLYIASPINANGIYQFDLNAGNGNPDSVKASKYKLLTTPYPAGGFVGYNALQLANNGKIYATRLPLNASYMAVINNPNVAGAGCNFADSAINFNGKITSYGLSNFVDSYKYPPALALGPPAITVSSSTTLSCSGSQVVLHALGLNSYTWSTGGASATINVSPITTSVYSIQGQDANGCSTSQTFTLYVNLCTLLEDKRDKLVPINIFPNPNHGEFTVILGPSFSGQFTLLNSFGQAVFSKTIVEGENLIKTQGLTEGIYYFRIITSEGKEENGILNLE